VQTKPSPQNILTEADSLTIFHLKPLAKLEYHPKLKQRYQIAIVDKEKKTLHFIPEEIRKNLHMVQDIMQGIHGN